MKNITIRVLCLLLAVMMSGMLLLACSDETEDPKDPVDSEVTPPEDDPAEDDPYNIPDSLPAADYNEDEFNILYYSDNQLPFFYTRKTIG